MKFNLIITVIFTLVNISYSQDYSIVRQNGQYSYYIYNPLNLIDTTLATILIDSVSKKGNSTEYFNFSSPETKYNPKLYDYCTVINGPSWIGRKVISSVDTDYIISIHNDTLKFLRNSALYENWIFYKFKKDTIVEAVVSSINYMPVVNGIMDSVKTITFTVKNNKNFGINHPANNRKFMLSKNYGLISGVDWRYFPDSLNNEFHICGLPEPEIGIKPITFRQVFDYDIGDEFHYSEGDTDETRHGNFSENIVRVLDKQWIDSNLVEYTFANFFRYINLNGTVRDTLLRYREATDRIDLDVYPLFQPEESIIDMKTYSGLAIIDYKVTLNKYGARQVITNDRTYYYNKDTCYRQINSVYDRYYEYIEGCGAYFNEYWGYGHTWKKLNYYNKNGKIWGNQLDVPTSVYPYNTSKFYFLYEPNSSKLIIDFNESGRFSLRISDINGRDIISPIANELNSVGQKEIDLSSQNLTQGIYFVILSYDGNLIPFKFAVFK